MSMTVLAVLNGWEIVLIFAVILVLFGAKKLPELAKGLGHGIKEFKKATRDVTDELQSAMDTDAPPPPPRKLPERTVAEAPGSVPQQAEPAAENKQA
jgi:sec-independent protein translocase protein TatA